MFNEQIKRIGKLAISISFVAFYISIHICTQRKNKICIVFFFWLQVFCNQFVIKQTLLQVHMQQLHNRLFIMLQKNVLFDLLCCLYVHYMKKRHLCNCLYKISEGFWYALKLFLNVSFEKSDRIT